MAENRLGYMTYIAQSICERYLKDAFYADKTDVDECWGAVSEVKRDVDKLRQYDFQKSNQKMDDVKDIFNKLTELTSNNEKTEENVDLKTELEEIPSEIDLD